MSSFPAEADEQTPKTANTLNEDTEFATQTTTRTPTNKNIAILTSGGDAQGMNAAIRAAVRTGIAHGLCVWGVREGFQGLVDGGAKIAPMCWNDVGNVVALGGTILQSARCEAFKTKAGRRAACLNLIRCNVRALLVIGGDGSLTGASMLRDEWCVHAAELAESGAIDDAQLAALGMRPLTLVGLVGSIDNDFVGTDITIGAYSALHRIVEALDALRTTASSHRRAFVVEVMGRRCGWLALMAAVAAGADFAFLPECPAMDVENGSGGDWRTQLVATVEKRRQDGRQIALVVVAEGAVDAEMRPIRSDDVRAVLSERLHFDTRVTVLGHIQRGGIPAAFDRYLATLQGVRAVELAIRSDAQEASSLPPPPLLVGISGNKIVERNLSDCVAKTRLIDDLFTKRDFAGVFALRDEDFRNMYAVFTAINAVDPRCNLCNTLPPNNKRIAVVHVGAPACGMNVATRAIAQFGSVKGFCVLGVFGGWNGLLVGDVRRLTPADDWACEGGSRLGTNRTTAADAGIAEISAALQRNAIAALIVVGGFEAFLSTTQLAAAQQTEAALRMPVVYVPATISNNIPGTEYTLGADTALNVIVEACDRLKQSASSSHKRVFVLEVQGSNCGYLATVGELAAGAAASYIPEEGVTLEALARDVRMLRAKFSDDRKRGRILIRNENCSPPYDTPTVAAILQAEAGGAFDARPCIIGHLQQGGAPSPLDRVYATRLAVRSVAYVADQLRASAWSTVAIGVVGAKVVLQGVDELNAQADVAMRRPRVQWWLPLRRIARLLSGAAVPQ